MWLRRNLLSCLLAMREAESTRATVLTIIEKLKLPHIHRLGGGGADILAVEIHGLECRNKILWLHQLQKVLLFLSTQRGLIRELKCDCQGLFVRK